MPHSSGLHSDTKKAIWSQSIVSLTSKKTVRFAGLFTVRVCPAITQYPLYGQACEAFPSLLCASNIYISVEKLMCLIFCTP